MDLGFTIRGRPAYLLEDGEDHGGDCKYYIADAPAYIHSKASLNYMSGTWHTRKQVGGIYTYPDAEKLKEMARQHADNAEELDAREAEEKQRKAEISKVVSQAGQREFKVGDRVRCSGYLGYPVKDKTGVVTCFWPNKSEKARVGVKFDHYSAGLHDMEGRCQNGHGLYVPEDTLTLLADAEEWEPQVGDRVQGKGVEDGVDLTGQVGTIMRISDLGYISVEWDEPFSEELHDCEGDAQDGHGWNCAKEALSPLATSAEGNSSEEGTRMAQKFTAKDVTIARTKGVKTIEIGEMPIREAIEWLKRKADDDEKEVAVHQEIIGFPLDVAINFYDALLDVFGFVQKVDTPGFWGPSPPTMISVPVSATEVRQVPWGRIVIPGVDGFVQFSPSGNLKLVISGKVKQKDLPKVEAAVEACKQRLKTHSIYKGKAIEVDLEWTREEASTEFHPVESAPKFTIPVDGADKSRLVFSQQVTDDIDVGLFTLIERQEFCRKNGIPLKRAVLLAGQFGTGKTMTAWVAAKLAISKGMTFIYLKSAHDLAACFEFARLYQDPGGVVVFAEDLDKAIPSPESDDYDEENVNRLQNAFDGVNTKTDKIITVLTTNYLDQVPQSLLRPGRIDLLVKVELPDAEAAARLVQQYGGKLLSPEIDFKKVGEALKGHIASQCREAVERSKLACICRLFRENPDVDQATASIEGQVMEMDIIQAVHQMRDQHELLKPKLRDDRSDVEKAAQIRANAEMAAARMAYPVGDSDLDDEFMRA